MNKRRGVVPPAPPPRRWWSVLTNTAKAGVGLGLVLSTAAATAWGGYRLALTSPRFSVQRVEVETSHRFNEKELAQRAGVELGSSLLGLDLRAAEQRLLADPWIESVRITRKLPHTLRVQLREHEASALAALDGELFLVDAKGEPFKAWQAGDPHDLPALTGVTLEALAKDRAGAVARLATGLSVLEHYQRLPVSRTQRAQEVHLNPDGAVVLVVGTRAVSLHLGHGPWPKKLLMVAEVMRQFERQKELPGIVFLDNEMHPERVVVRMR